MWERSKCVVAYVLTSRLLGVANKFALFIIVDGFATNGCQHDAENDQYRQPDLPHKGGVVWDFIQQTCQEAPTHGAEETRALSQIWGRNNALMWIFRSFLTKQTMFSMLCAGSASFFRCITLKERTEYEPNAADATCFLKLIPTVPSEVNPLYQDLTDVHWSDILTRKKNEGNLYKGSCKVKSMQLVSFPPLFTTMIARISTDLILLVYLATELDKFWKLLAFK